MEFSRRRRDTRRRRSPSSRLALPPTRRSISAPRYSTPAEFLIITLTINGLASLGLHTAVASAVDESKTAEHVSSLSLAALGSIAVLLVWAFAAAWAARLSGRKIPRDVLWRVSCYTTAFTLLVIPLTSLWLASLELLLPDEDVSDLIRYVVPAIPIAGASLVAYIRGVIRGFEGRRLAFLFFFILLAIIVPICVRVAPAVPIIGEIIDENSRPSLNAASGDAIESLKIRRFGDENFGAHSSIGERERFQLLIEVRNLSGITVHNVIVRLEGPFLRGPQKYVFYSIATCDGCGRDDVGRADLYWESFSQVFTPADILGRLLMNALELGALRREGIPPEERTPYTLLVDEAHTFAGADGALDVLLTAARKYRLSLVLAAQALALFPTRFQTLALGNAGHQFLFRLPQKEAQRLAPDLFEPQGNVLRPRLHAHDPIEYLPPSEEIAARTKELANLPIGACYWLDRGKPYKARRIQVRPPDELPLTAGEVNERITNRMRGQQRAQ